MKNHLVFYDGECGICDQSVNVLLKIDLNKLFVFAPLQGETANEVLKELKLPRPDTLILVENYTSPQHHTEMYAKAVFRICWLLGGWWSVFGVFSFLPGWSINWAYKIVAYNRHRLNTKISCTLPDPNQADRFLK